MFKIKIADLEDSLGITIKRNEESLGLDTATKTGYAYLKTDVNYMTIDCGFIDTSKMAGNPQLRYDTLIDAFNGLIKSGMTVVVEDVYYGRNVSVTILLGRIGAWAYMTAKERGCARSFVKASTARTNLSLNGTAKKEDLMAKVNQILGLSLTNSDEIDAIVLAINGVLETKADPKDKRNK
jgi:Holliday junction resolvasome RuvABC endonuclease subunit